jgi:hypothetical protein
MSVILPPPPPPSTKEEQSKEAFLRFIKEKFENGEPISKKRFTDKFEDINPQTGAPISTAIETKEEYFIEEDSKECGLTRAEYEFLLDDIEFQIAEANRKYGCGEPGYIDKHGDYHPFPGGKRVRSRKLSPEDVAIARGIIKITRPIEEEEF